jgi:serine/threonine protein kinase
MYSLGKSLGSGGFAEVFLGKNDKGKKFAIKRMSKNSCRDELRRREIEAGKRLRNHKRIAHFYDAFEDEEFYYLVFELVKGTDLFGILENNKFKPLREKKIKKMFRQLLEAVQYSHKNFVVHRDIKL